MLNRSAFNGAGLNGAVLAWVLATAAASAGCSLSASAILNHRTSAAITPAVNVAANAVRWASGSAQANSGSVVIANQTFAQAGGAQISATTDVLANVAGTFSAVAVGNAGASMLAVPAAVLGATSVGASASLAAQATYIQLGGASATVSANGAASLLVSRRSPAAGSASASLWAEARLNDEARLSYASPIAQADVFADASVSTNQAAAMVATANTVTVATYTFTGGAVIGALSSTMTAASTTLQYPYIPPVQANATVTATATRICLGVASVSASASGQLSDLTQYHRGVAAADSSAVLNHVSATRTTPAASGINPGADSVTAGVRFARPTASVTCSANTSASSFSTIAANTEMSASADASNEGAVYRPAPINLQGGASAALSESLTRTALQGQAAILIFPGLLLAPGIKSLSVATATATATAAVVNSPLQYTLHFPVVAANASASSMGAASQWTEHHGYADMRLSCEATSAAGFRINAARQELPRPYIFNSGVLNSSPLGYAQADPFIWSNGRVFIVADSIANGGSRDPAERTFTRVAQNTLFTREAQNTVFRRAA